MNKIKNICLALLLAVAFASCSKWLDVNESTDSPASSAVAVNNRLTSMQHYFQYAYETAGMRSAMITGVLTRTWSSGNSHNELCAWNPVIGSTTTPYQMWFIGCAANIPDMIKKATDEEAWHYIGATKIIEAWGYMTMVDWYGEMPFTEAVGDALTPKYDTGETIFKACVAKLDTAITYLQKEQPVTATALSKGDGWNGGDVQKWIKLAYGLKARWLNNLSKKSDLYDPDAILDALSHAAQSNSEATIVKHYNDEGDTDKDVLLGDPLKTSILYDGIGMNTYFFYTKWYADLLTNTFTGGSNVEDPRTDKILPSSQQKINGVLKLIRTVPIDVMNSNIRTKNGPILASYAALGTDETSTAVRSILGLSSTDNAKRFFVASTDAARAGDTIYVNLRSQGAMFTAQKSLMDGNDDTYKDTDGRILSTGSFFTRPDAPGMLLTYSELCFIKAEVLFRKGEKGIALTAYKDGIRSHMELMNQKLATYITSVNPNKYSIDQSKIDAFLGSSAVAQNVGDLTMAKIMQQKFIACSFSLQNWNDMRRFDYSTPGEFGVVYPDFKRPYEFDYNSGSTKITGTVNSDSRYWFRRMIQCSHERNYNSDNLIASNPEALLTTNWSRPVWWDTKE
ncbi:SusD/RagB family nutrient-binding outer membrane lipoprotein [Bacteroides ihuae]|uniref:SusD/RagB family nutrient-binding outer membrane lipoprotein n=1 Tax=Bacteroides ihuae TaxID=1852362 RepID=UPI0008D9FB14|nr:SusD/RagB family nutrient-binding outer membrane lipoprotein [Bacteroides ihuae]